MGGWVLVCIPRYCSIWRRIVAATFFFGERFVREIRFGLFTIVVRG